MNRVVAEECGPIRKIVDRVGIYDILDCGHRRKIKNMKHKKRRCKQCLAAR